MFPGTDYRQVSVDTELEHTVVTFLQKGASPDWSPLFPPEAWIWPIKLSAALSRWPLRSWQKWGGMALGLFLQADCFFQLPNAFKCSATCMILCAVDMEQKPILKSCCSFCRKIGHTSIEWRGLHANWKYEFFHYSCRQYNDYLRGVVMRPPSLSCKLQCKNVSYPVSHFVCFCQTTLYSTQLTFFKECCVMT